MKIAVLTSGGDSPGMNAAIMAISLAAIARGHDIVGVMGGYEGLLVGEFQLLSATSVDGIGRFGGTMLGSARSAAFPTLVGQTAARDHLRAAQIGALIVIGGNGSLAGAHALAAGDSPCQIIGLPASIDNDIGLTDLCIGVDTAVNTIVEACDRISDTARAHRRAFLVEVMGRHCGFLAMRAGIAAGADAVLFGEERMPEEDIVDKLRNVLRRSFVAARGHRRCLILKSEGVPIATARLAERVRNHMANDAPGVELRETILGHVVRGGSPSALDRLIAQRLGLAAVKSAEAGWSDIMLAWNPPQGIGRETTDHAIRAIAIQDVLDETVRLLDGSSEVTQRRIRLVREMETLVGY